jgi:thiol-disulfide isomerase/thioredoxin
MKPAAITAKSHTLPCLAALFLCSMLQSCSEEPAVALTNSGQANTQAAPLPVSATFDAATSTFQDLQGRGLEIASFEGKKVFVNYWATWCAPCIREIPSLNRAAEALADENYLFLLASDESVADIRDFIDERGFGGHFVKLNGFFGSYGIHAVPSSSLYSEDGELLQSWAGAFEWDSEEMLDEIRAAASLN